MAIRYASTQDLEKFPYLSIAGPTKLNENPFLMESLKRKTKKIDALGIAGQDVNTAPGDLKLGGDAIRDPSNPNMAYLPGSPESNGSGKELEWLQGMFKELYGGGSGGGNSMGLPDITGKASKFSDFYNPVSTAGSDADFASYLGAIQFPSSVDAVQKQLEQEYLQQAMEGIGRDTEDAVANAKLDFLDRGLGDAARTSDIEMNTLGQIRAEGGRTAAGARTQLGMAELARQKAREDMNTSALGEKYRAGVARESQANQIGATGAISDAQALNDLLKTQYSGEITTGEGAAGRAATSSDTFMKLMTDYILKNKELGQQDEQFYEGLLSQVEQNALQRTAQSNIAAMNRAPDEGGWADKLFTNIIDSVAGGATAPIGEAAGNKFLNLFTKTKKK